MDNQAIIAIAALVISEILAYIPIKSSGIVQLVVNILKRVFGGSDRDLTIR